mmetsp:Transcript_118043/g.376374  ORF Transcript_118043/g.376374 Transcript_118043/m.376374 type:complete len:433 (+) Transcript_118043:272-1570(+)
MPSSSSSSSKDVERTKLRETEEQLLQRRREFDAKDKHIRQQTDSLVETVTRRSQEALVREQLAQELQMAQRAHEQNMVLQREMLQKEHAEAAQEHRLRLDGEADLHLQQLEAFVRAHAEGAELLPPDVEGAEEGEFGDAEQEGDVDRGDLGLPSFHSVLRQAHRRFAEQVKEMEASNQELVSYEEQRAARAFKDLIAVQAEARLLTQERDSEVEASAVSREALAAEQRVAQRKRDRFQAEIRSQVSETEAMQDEHRGLEGKTRALQHDLNKAVYVVGQRDQELRVMNSELQEVRQSLSSIQDEMDEVNRQLKEQCSRVQRVESSVRISRDLGEKVMAMREMVKESHAAMGQLCGFLEHERTRREDCAMGLRQQKVRTELLLQLLHHFKNRTNDLSPQALLSRSLESTTCNTISIETVGSGFGAPTSLGGSYS